MFVVLLLLCNIVQWAGSNSLQTPVVLNVEEVSMKGMDSPSVTEMNRGGVYEMDRQNKCQVLECVIKFYPFQWHFNLFGTLSVYPFHRHLLYSFL